MRTITARSVIVAMNFIGPSHLGHFSASMLHTRCSSVAQSIRDARSTFFSGFAAPLTSTTPRASTASQTPAFGVARSGSAAPPAPAAPAAVLEAVIAFAAHAFARRSNSCGRGPGTTAARHGEWGANTPW